MFVKGGAVDSHAACHYLNATPPRHTGERLQINSPGLCVRQEGVKGGDPNTGGSSMRNKSRTKGATVQLWRGVGGGVGGGGGRRAGGVKRLLVLQNCCWWRRRMRKRR